VVAGSATDPARTGYMPVGAVQYVDVDARRIVLRPGVDTSHLLDPHVSLEARAGRVADVVANVGPFGFWHPEDGTFLTPR